jgi:zinc and cadmium transporter
MDLSINFILSLTAALALNGLASLCGGLIPSPWLHRHMGALLAVASGVLLGTAFFELMPEAIYQAQHEEIAAIFTACLLGFLGFFLVESLLGSHATGQTGHRHDQAGPLILIGDGLHNFADGLAITSAFMVDSRMGWLTALTVISHELPQEIADYTILIARGWTKARTLLALLLVQCTGFLGAASCIFLAQFSWGANPYILAFSAGGFVYVAAADLMPQLKSSRRMGILWQSSWLFTGVAVIWLLQIFTQHSRGH